MDTAIGKGFTAQMRRGVEQAGMKMPFEPTKVVTHADGSYLTKVQSGFEAATPYHMLAKESALKIRGPMPAPEYEAVPGDELDRKVEFYARQLTSDAGHDLMIYRLSKGEYQIANQKVYLSWSRNFPTQNPAQGQVQWKDSSEAEVFVQEDDTVTPILEPLSTYLEHAANINYELKNGKAVTRLPDEMRLSFNEVGTHVMEGDDNFRLIAMKMALGQAKRRERAALEWAKNNNKASACSASVGVDAGSCRPFSPVHKCGSCVSPATVIGANGKDGFVMPGKAASLLPQLQVRSNQEAVEIGRTGFRSRSIQRVSLTSQSQPTCASSPWVMPQREGCSLRSPQVGFQQQGDSSVAQGGLTSLRFSTLGRSSVAAQQQHITRRRDIGFEHWRSPNPLATPLRRSMGSLRATTMMPPVLACRWASSEDVLKPSLSTHDIRVKVTHSTRGWMVTDNIQQSVETVQSLSCPRRQYQNPNIFQKSLSEEPLMVHMQPQVVMCAQ